MKNKTPYHAALRILVMTGLLLVCGMSSPGDDERDCACFTGEQPVECVEVSIEENFCATLLAAMQLGLCIMAYDAPFHPYRMVGVRVLVASDPSGHPDGWTMPLRI